MNSMPRIIGLVGRSRCGKDTVASVFTDSASDVGIGLQLIRLSAPVKAATCALFGLTPDDVEGPNKELPHSNCCSFPQPTPRSAMVWVTDMCMQQGGASFFRSAYSIDLIAGSLGRTTS